MSFGSVNVPIGERGFTLPLCRGVSTTPGATALKRILSFAYFVREAQRDRVDAALGHHRNRCRNPGDGVIGQRRADAGHAAAPALRQHLPHRRLRHEDETLKVGGDKGAKFLRGVLREGLRKIDARVVHHMVDRAELLDRRFRHFLGSLCPADISIHQREVGRGGVPCLRNASRSRHHVIAALQKRLNNGCADALRGAGDDDCFPACHIELLLSRLNPKNSMPWRLTWCKQRPIGDALRD